MDLGCLDLGCISVPDNKSTADTDGKENDACESRSATSKIGKVILCFLTWALRFIIFHFNFLFTRILYYFLILILNFVFCFSSFLNFE